MIAFVLALLAMLASGLDRPPAPHWRVLPVAAPGPYIDVLADSKGNRWISSRGVEGLIRLDESGTTTIFPTRGFEPAYLTLGQDGRIWTTLHNHPNQIGAMTETGQFTTFLQPHGVGSIPVSKIMALGNFGLMYVGARAGLIGIFGGEGGEQPYSTGLLQNDDIAMTIAPGFVPWFTECCLPGGGAVGVGTQSELVEFALPYVECARPAGIVVAPTLSEAFVPCAGAERTILVSVDEHSGRTRVVPFPGRYPARVNTVALGAPYKSLYFSTGAAHGIVEYQAEKQVFSTIAVPDKIVPTAIVADAFGGRYYVLAGDRRALYEYEP